MKLINKVAFITGAGSGIGAATARQMANEGASIVVAGLPKNAGESTAKELTSAGRKAIAIETDVSNAEQMKAALEETVHAFGCLDVVVASAGIQLHQQDTHLHTLVDDVWDQTHNVNYRGVYLTCKYALAQFIEQANRGVIVIVASVTALNGRSTNPAYLSGKHGLLGLNRYIAVHYAKHRIRCNAICPGALEQTPNHDKHPDPLGRAERLQETIPLGRLGRPDDIAPFITFLASSDASYATGATFVIDGGWSVA
ncbi:SDR family oxidoreductase [Chloroflexi bacterium TSY]|nr:SDR family oxidoreductase [Chloroflexi bacterium TSY]